MSETIDTKNHPTVKALEEHRQRLGLNDTQFARKLRVSPATWSTMRGGTYGAEDKQPMLDMFAAALAQLQDQSDSRGGDGRRHVIVETSDLKAALAAVRRAAGEPRNRLIVYLAHTGGGKTTLARRILDAYLGSAVVIEATETWRDSYFGALKSISKELGISGTLTNVIDAESAILHNLALAPRILVVDEAHHAGKRAINALKLIINRCPETRVVVLAIPTLWDRMQQAAAPEAAQLRSRTCAKILVGELRKADVGHFLEAKIAGLNGAEKEAIAEACSAANRFGLFDTLQRICDEVADETGGVEPVTLDHVKSAIKRVEALRS